MLCVLSTPKFRVKAMLTFAAKRSMHLDMQRSAVQCRRGRAAVRSYRAITRLEDYL